MRRYKIIIQYDGSFFNGWQLQNEMKTVQGEIENGLKIITKSKNRFQIKGSGRTDSGVHALGQVGHFDIDTRLNNQELKSLKRLKANESHTLTTRLKHIITSVEGDDNPKTVRDFVDNNLLAMDSRELRKYIRQISPDIDLFFFTEGSDKSIDLPVTIQFFYPDLGNSN